MMAKEARLRRLVDSAETMPVWNCYVFAKVMQDRPDVCLRLAERILGEQIDHIGKVEPEIEDDEENATIEVIVESTEATVLARGVRFDAYLKGSGALVDMEMQAIEEPDLAFRTAYYQSWLTRRALDQGDKLADMPRRNVAFICMHDPLGGGEAIYRVRRGARGESGRDYSWEDGEESILLNAKAWADCPDPGISSVLKYLDTGKVETSDSLVADMDDAKRRAYEQESWVGSMNIAEYSRLAREEAALERGMERGMEKGIARGCADERMREAALLKAMSAKGRSATDIVAAISNGDRDALYLEYGID